MGQLWALQLGKGDDVVWTCIVGSEPGSVPEGGGLDRASTLTLIGSATAPAKELAGFHLVEPNLEDGIQRLLDAGRREEAEAAAALLFVVKNEREPRCLLDEELMASTVDVLDGLETPAALTVLELLENYEPSCWVEVLRRLKLGDVDPGFQRFGSLTRRLLRWDVAAADDNGPPRALVDIAEHLPPRVRDRMAESVLPRIPGPRISKDPLTSAGRELDLLRALAPDETWASDPKVLAYFGATLREALDSSVSDAPAAAANLERIVRTLADAHQGPVLDDELRAGLDSSTWLTEPERTRILGLTGSPATT
jgi:hypothetical protein